MSIGKSLVRVDALDKVTAQAKYVGDIEPQNAFVDKVVRSTIANGKV